MGLEDDLRARLVDEEDAFVERKPGDDDREEIRAAVVGFANTVRAPDTGVLFLGVAKNGTANGNINDPDKTQRNVTKYLQRCYPPIADMQLCAFRQDGKHVVAVVVPESRNRPHFAGPAYARQGSETVVASEKLFDQMIDDRSDLCWELKRHVNRLVTVIREGPAAGVGNVWGRPEEAKLISVDRHFVVIGYWSGSENYSPRYDNEESYALCRIMLERDVHQWLGARPRLRVASSAVR